MMNLDNMGHFKELSEVDMLSVAKMAGFLKVPGKNTAIVAHPHVLSIIVEFGQWVHVGLAPAGQQPRRQDLHIVYGSGFKEGLK